MRIGTYEVLLELGRGGMGTVFLGRALGSGGFERLVAIKRAHPELLATATGAERFLREARLAAQVHHSNVISTHAAGSDTEGPFLVCDYVEGASLDALLERVPAAGARVPVPIVLRMIADGLLGLHAVHETSDANGVPLGILHRDISVQNLLVGRDGVTRLSDFGIAKSTALGTALTGERDVVGKLVYAAPEYLKRLPVGRALDVYAMGISLYIALAGKSPWKSVDDVQLVAEITHEGAPSLATLGLGLNFELEQIVDRACRRDAEWRYQTAREMLDALERAAQAGPGIASQREVAAYIEQALGSDLAARREAIRARSAELAAAADASASVIASRSDSSHNAQTTTTNLGMRFERRWPLRVVIAAAVLGIAFAALYASRGEQPAAAPPLERAQIVKPAPPPVPVAAEAEPPKAEAPELDAPAAAAVPALSPERHAPTTPRPRSSHFGDIKKTNPYR